jgi:hypothetical protein
LQGLPSKTMTMPFRIWVADIAIKSLDSEYFGFRFHGAKLAADPTGSFREPFANPVV